MIYGYDAGRSYMESSYVPDVRQPRSVHEMLWSLGYQAKTRIYLDLLITILILS